MPFFSQLAQHISLNSLPWRNRAQTQSAPETGTLQSDLGSSSGICSTDALSASVDVHIGSSKDVTISEGNTHTSESSSRSASLSDCATSHSVLYSERCKAHNLIEKLREIVEELENNLMEEQEQNFKFHLALERKTEQMHVLSAALAAERHRNQCLIQLIQDAKNGYNTDDSKEFGLFTRCKGNDMCSSTNVHESIKPLLLQQRFDELKTLYQQCLSQLAKKEKALIQYKYEKEDTEARYDALFDSHRSLQKSFEDVCSNYLLLEAKKNLQIELFKNALNHAADCILIAWNVLDDCNCADQKMEVKFRSNLRLFLKAVRKCHWIKLNSANDD